MRLGIVVALLASVSARADPSAGDLPGQIGGRVMERGSTTPIAGATVSAGDFTTTTDGSGQFLLTLPAGDNELHVSAPHYQPLAFVEKVSPGERLEVEYRLLTIAGARQYRTVVRGEARHEGERFTLQAEELRQLPGSLGDPFRALGSLPGVTTPVPILPYYVVRGATPGMNGFFLDGMRVPQLFHALAGGGVIHPDLVDNINFYPGAYDVSFGHYAGGVVDAQTRMGRGDAPFHGEIELRLYDVSALVETRLPGGVTVMAGGHFGDPSIIIHLLQPGADALYWDYQLRVDWRFLTVEAIGSYDYLSITRELELLPPGPNDTYSLMFHRVQIRAQGRRGRIDGEAAIVGGYDQLFAFGGQGVEKLSLSARAVGRIALPHFRLQAGLDGELSQFQALNFSSDASSAKPDELGDLGGARAGAEAGAYVEGTLLLDDFVHRPLSLNAGVRADVYHAGDVTLLGVDPRLLLKFQPQSWLNFNAAFGLYQQPPTFPLPLPGVDTFALQLGLQRAWQGSVGIGVLMPESFSLSLTGFYQKFFNINDVTVDFTPTACTSPPPESLTGIAASVMRQVDGQSFGGELLLRRSKGRVTGWIAYTLSRSERAFTCGLRPSDFDQTHVLNLVVQARLPWRLVAGGRLYFATGRPYTLLTVTPEQLLTGDVQAPVRNNSRLPDFVEVDLRLDREWIFSRFVVSAFIEVVNLTFSETYLGVNYPVEMRTLPSGQTIKITRYDEPRQAGFPWVLPSLGVRGKF